MGTEQNQIQNEIKKMKSKKGEIGYSLYNLFIRGIKRYINIYEIIDEDSLEYCTFSQCNISKIIKNNPKNNLNNIINKNKINNKINITSSTSEMSKDKENDKIIEIKKDLISSGNNILVIKFIE